MFPILKEITISRSNTAEEEEEQQKTGRKLGAVIANSKRQTTFYNITRYAVIIIETFII